MTLLRFKFVIHLSRIRALVLIPLLGSCSTATKDAQISSQAAESFDNTAESTAALLPHPAVANAAATRQLVIGQTTLAEEDLSKCRQESIASAQQALSKESLLEAIQLTKASVSQNPSFFHWCFYNSAQKLDWDLEERLAGSAMIQRVDLFSHSMKAMFILARALDEHFGQEDYFIFLRQRYISISQEHFARNLREIGPPLGKPKWIQPPKKHEKPAQTFGDLSP